MTKWKWKQIRGCQGFKKGWGWEEGSGLYKGNMRDPCSNGNVLYFDSISVSILVVILYRQDFHWGKVGKGYMVSLYFFYNPMWIYSYLKRKCLI